MNLPYEILKILKANNQCTSSYEHILGISIEVNIKILLFIVK